MTHGIQKERRVYSRFEAAKRAGMGITAFDEALKRKQFPAIRVGRRVLIPAAAFDRILDGEALLPGSRT